jgi:hypothetical protein
MICLSESDIRSLSQPARNELLGVIQRWFQTVEPAAAPAAAPIDDDEMRPADLSVSQATRFLEPCHEKTKKVLRAIVAGDSPEFQISVVANAAGKSIDEIGGVWGGLTKRVRTVLQKDKAYLVVWTDHTKDDQNNWIDSTGVISKITRESFRQVFGM